MKDAPKPIDLHALLALLAEKLNLTWVYAQESTPTFEAVLELPPDATLAQIRAAVNAGDLLAVEELAVNLEGPYPVFATRLRTLAQAFDEAGIHTLISGGA